MKVRSGAHPLGLGLPGGQLGPQPRRAPARARPPAAAASAARSSASSSRADVARPSCSASSARRASALNFNVASAARFWAADSAPSSSSRACSCWSTRAPHRGRERGVLGGALVGELAVGLRPARPGRGRRRAGVCEQLGVGDPGGGGAEHDGRDGGERLEPGDATEERGGHEDRGDREQGNGDGQPGAALSPTCSRGRHKAEVMPPGRRNGRDTRVRGAALRRRSRRPRAPRGAERRIRSSPSSAGDAEPADGVPQRSRRPPARPRRRRRAPAPAG